MHIDDLEAYIRQLQGHDWFYDYSDDHSVWSRGRDNSARLYAKAKQDPVFMEAMDIFTTYNYPKGVAGKLSWDERRAIRDQQLAALRARIEETAE